MAKPKPTRKDPLDELATGDLKRIIALMLWKQRHENPEMAVLINRKDLKGLRDCAAYLEVEPDVRIFRRQGDPDRTTRRQQAWRREHQRLQGRAGRRVRHRVRWWRRAPRTPSSRSRTTRRTPSEGEAVRRLRRLKRDSPRARHAGQQQRGARRVLARSW
jgi:hypothetical protein